jgi:hypothetical protein
MTTKKKKVKLLRPEDWKRIEKNRLESRTRNALNVAAAAYQVGRAKPLTSRSR